MTAYIQFRMKYLLHPWNDKMRADGVSAWCLVREVVQPRNEVKPGEFITHFDIVDSKPVALFSLDSEAETFMRFLLDGHGHEIYADRDFEELHRIRQQRARMDR